MFGTIDIWCEDCGAAFRNTCHCPETTALPAPRRNEKWIGADRHEYVGDPDQRSLAFHSDTCPCHAAEDR